MAARKKLTAEEHRRAALVLDVETAIGQVSAYLKSDAATKPDEVADLGAAKMLREAADLLDPQSKPEAAAS